MEHLQKVTFYYNIAGITKEQVQFICDVNPDKFNCFTPGTNIPIISEEECRESNPDYFLVLPWHFKKNN